MGHLNKEQQEVLMNNWNSVLQPLIVRMGTNAIDDNMLAAFVQIAVSSFHRAQRVTSGGIFVLQGLIAAVEHRIEPHISSFMEFLICSLRMQDSDEMSTRLSAGLISDISNSISEGFVQWMPQVMPLLQAILNKENFDPEAKLVTIIAFGDMVLAAGPVNFVQYLQETQKAFFAASMMSIAKGSSPEEAELLS